ncbi:MarR family winged helix-turn-helix transcriptional regulator [Phycicoccus flavus]|uniref:MarR family transcriptional regulator n=1 Tax=Phycicoccus flavus TaxID=2502783 RepID=A0A8T6R846_9MICO|nr:MarR family transcriptional regulator [Phycicoccus flavus]NHA70046.1 MarR family transcriptional regulator [Phycicoccus flavus]
MTTMWTERGREEPDGAAGGPEGVDVVPMLDAGVPGLWVLSSVLSTSLADARRGHGVTAGQMRSLILVASHPRASAAEISRHQNVTTSTAKRMVDRLVSADLVSRVRSRTDRRRFDLAVTQRGREILDGVRAERRRMVVDLLSRMDPEDRTALTRGLVALAAVAGEPDPSVLG